MLTSLLLRNSCGNALLNSLIHYVALWEWWSHERHLGGKMMYDWTFDMFDITREESNVTTENWNNNIVKLQREPSPIKDSEKTLEMKRVCGCITVVRTDGLVNMPTVTSSPDFRTSKSKYLMWSCPVIINDGLQKLELEIPWFLCRCSKSQVSYSKHNNTHV